MKDDIVKRMKLARRAGRLFKALAGKRVKFAIDMDEYGFDENPIIAVGFTPAEVYDRAPGLAVYSGDICRICFFDKEKPDFNVARALQSLIFAYTDRKDVRFRDCLLMASHPWNVLRFRKLWR